LKRFEKERGEKWVKTAAVNTPLITAAVMAA
jgi:hypothetical protein